ncbi:MAG: alpha-2-macroglobulin family protein, partial [Flavisolibacter sp.]
QNDRLNLRESIYRYYDGGERAPEKYQIRSFFFTDRSIYRPGQLVYFKGIAINSLNGQNEITVDHKTTVYLRNANYEITDSVLVTTNEFGSYNGKFQLPQNLLNGNFTITDKGNTGITSFSVEEYKRPKFYVEFEKIKNSYKVNETVTVFGNAKAYAGNNIDGAKVSYRVVRKPRFIYTWMFRKSWFPPVAEMEIAHGEATTDKDGKFTIQFTAIPDKNLDPKTDPVFDYAVHADVTDINGETRSGDKTVTAGYKSLILQVDLPDKLHVDSLKQIIIRSENMNGDFQKAFIEIAVRKLNPADNRLIRNRYWEEPDQFVMSKEEYIRHFPHDEYKNETDYKTWEKGDFVMRKADTTNSNGIFALPNASLTNGYYVIEITTKDKDGKEVKDSKYFELYNPSDNSFNKPEYLWAKSSDEVVEPGSKTQMQIGSSAQNVFLVQQVDKLKETKETIDFTRLNNEKKTFTYTATESDRGGFGVTFFFIKDNRFYQFNDAVNVPWSNKDLAIEYSTFRDKTLPGSEEKWKVKLTGYKNEKIAAEMLASMYDASLDQFKPHNWTKPGIWPLYSQQNNWSGFANFISVQSDIKWVDEEYLENKKQYDWFDFATGDDGPRPPSIYRRSKNGMANEMVTMAAPMAQSEAADSASFNFSVAKGKTATVGNATGNESEETEKKLEPDPTIQPRKNFNETAFFFPDLRTDENGNIEFSFTAPEALTKWKIQTLAHTKGLAFGFSSKEMVTQKELMVQPNMTRFLRQGDRMELVAKIVNMSDKEMTGQAQLQLFDATTNQSVDGWFINSFPNQYFTVAAGQSELVKFPIQVPFQFTNALTWRITARSGNFSDGEEEAVAVLTNKTLVTETMPMPMRGSGTKNFSFEKLLKSGSSETLQHQSLTVEYTSNPAWYAVQALPYLMEYPYECAEQIWNGYYANALASKIANASPRIKKIFEEWASAPLSDRRGAGGEADSSLFSNLQKNQELKSALLEETPWVLQAKTEAEQKKNIALLFDMVRMSNEMSGNLEKLKTMQSSNGGFVWFIGGPDDRYITQYIITGIGHLKKLGVNVDNLNSILNTSLPYLDKKIKEDYDNLVKRKADLKKQQVGYYEIQYLYMRSFFPENKIAAASQTAYNFYKKQSQQFWVKQNKYMQGMIALSLSRSGDKQIPAAILKSLDENSIKHEELGMYWKDNSFGYSWNWWYAPIETHSLMIEVFSEIGKDTRKVDDLRTWLIKNKQTNNWRTTKATADACYALLIQGTSWLSNEPVVEVKLGNTTVRSTETKQEAGTGYFKTI